MDEFRHLQNPLKLYPSKISCLIQIPGRVSVLFYAVLTSCINILQKPVTLYVPFSYRQYITKKYSVYSDVWSYGCVVYEIWSLGLKPYENIPNAKSMQDSIQFVVLLTLTTCRKLWK